ncbi:vicilin-like seed storage protein At2g18540 [Teleopsis dalmanni]|nr:vicilin-like seed storage protein At2g18540 [Teleopsis dalmanni]
MASKKREEDAKKLRHKLEEKRQKELDKLSNMERMKMKREDRRRKTVMLSRTAKERQRLNRFKIEAQWKPGFISDAEERLRDTWMSMRTEMLRTMKIVPYVYCVLYKSGNLTRTDILNYPDLYKSLEHGIDVLSDPQYMLD